MATNEELEKRVFELETVVAVQTQALRQLLDWRVGPKGPRQYPEPDAELKKGGYKAIIDQLP